METFDREIHGSVDIYAVNAEASAFMKQGIRFMEEATPAAIAEALTCFNRALRLRQQLPIETDPGLGYGLAACWLNRADALMQLGNTAQFLDGIQSYDEAIVLLRDLPLGEDPRVPRSLAIAYQNRGLALQVQSPSSVGNAIAAFTSAIEVLNDDRAATVPDRPYLLAAMWMNLANARATEDNIESAALVREAAVRSIAFVADLENDDAPAAEVGLRARHVICQAIARQLPLVAVSEGRMPEDVHEATDLVDDGLDLIRRWEQRGISRFRWLAYDLFRFGTRVYQRYQPQFLAEFVRENLDPALSSPDYVQSAEIRSATEEAFLT